MSGLSLKPQTPHATLPTAVAPGFLPGDDGSLGVTSAGEQKVWVLRGIATFPNRKVAQWCGQHRRQH